MKVLFISRATLYTDKGGDTVQIINTGRHLQELDVSVDIRLCNEAIDYAPYDLIHFFNIIRPADILMHIKKSGKPFVVSTIYVDYSEYEKNERSGMAGLFFKWFSADFIEYAKVLARAVINNEKIISPSYFFLGQRNAIRKIIKKAALVLPNSKSEYQRFSKHFNIYPAYKVIPNAIDATLFNFSEQKVKKDRNLVICVGRIEGRKNQLNLIKALNNSSYQLIIIGSASANHVTYYNLCRGIAASNVRFVSSLTQEELLEYYAAAKVHVLPSWFETTGLSSLEAAAMGCNIVITDKGDTREYFEDMAYYCNPKSPASIRQAVNHAAENDFNESLRNKIINQYTWSVTAAKTLEAYRIALLQ